MRAFRVLRWPVACVAPVASRNPLKYSVGELLLLGLPVAGGGCQRPSRVIVARSGTRIARVSAAVRWIAVRDATHQLKPPTGVLPRSAKTSGSETTGCFSETHCCASVMR